MAECWARWIEDGKCTVYSADCIDNIAWSAIGANNRWRIENHERWYNYIIEELVPYIRHLSGERNGFDRRILTFGCSMGAMHAANLFSRRPDLFEGVFSISGLYDSKMFFGEYMDDLVYSNTPVNYLNQMPWDHYYMGLYRQRKILIACGQGDWEGPLLDSTRWLDTICAQKGIPARFEYWGMMFPMTGLGGLRW